jgi:cytochrome c oxidase assembly protein Cox11
MPVYYFIQPDLPNSIKEITLSYTFFQDDSAQLTQADSTQP